MGTTFVTLTDETSGMEPGFWMRDEMLELWLRLLALHLPVDGQTRGLEVRNQWLLASRGCFTGCVPHGLEDACATQEGRAAVLFAIDSVLAALQRAKTPLDTDTLNLLGLEDGQFTAPIERHWLEDIGRAFLDLLDGTIHDGPSATEIMPGSKPYKRNPPVGS